MKPACQHGMFSNEFRFISCSFTMVGKTRKMKIGKNDKGKKGEN